MKLRWFVVLALLVEGTVVADSAAQQRVLMPVRSPAQTLITGTVIDEMAKPLANAPLRLRNLELRTIEQRARSTRDGEFTFVVTPEHPYVVELLDARGSAIAVGEVVIPQAGRATSTILSLPAKLPSGHVFGETLGAVLAAATGTAMTLAEHLPAVSPER